MKGFVFAAAIAAALSASLTPSSANADTACPTCPPGSGSWIFRPSYYSHDPATTVRIGRQYSSGPVFYRPYGEYVKTGLNYTRSAIQVGGQTFEQVNQWDSWYQVGGQF